MATSVSHARRTARARRHFRLRKKVTGTATRPRLVVTRSARHIAVQLVDDSVGRTLTSASTLEADLRAADGDKSAKARKVGELVGRRAVELGVTRWSSTAAAMPITAGSPRSPMAPAAPGWSSDEQVCTQHRLSMIERDI